MCGIGLAVSLSNKFHQNIIEDINYLQRHRGPDNSRIKVYERFSLCHQRLAILDLNKRADQPFLFENIEILFNGEIYNYKILRSELIKLGYSFFTYTDTEILAIGIYHFGKNFLKRIDGMFSILWVDHTLEKIFMSSDPFGIKKLYYFSYKDIFIVSSELLTTKDIVLKYGLPLEKNEKNLDYFLSYLSLPYSETPFKRIKTISEGDLLSLELRNNDKFSSQNIEKSFISKLINGYGNHPHLDLLNQILDESYQSDVDQAILLSGGIDSTNLALSSKSSKTNLKGYCINTNLKNDGFSDDISYAKIVSNKESIPLEIIYNNSKITISDVEETLGIVKNVGEFTAALSLNKLCKSISRDSIKVVHSGLGGDEMYGGYTIMKNFNNLTFFKYLISFSNNLKIKGSLIEIIKLLNYSSNQKRLIDFFLNNKVNDLVGNLVKWDFEIPRSQEFKNLKIGNYKDLVDFYFDVFLSSSHLPISDSVSMAHSIELRVPYLSRRIYSNLYPSINKICNKKSILKKRLKYSYPSEFINRSKSGMGISAKNLSPEIIDFLIEILFDKYIKDKYLIKKELFKTKLLTNQYSRFPYVLFAMLTYDKLTS